MKVRRARQPEAWMPEASEAAEISGVVAGTTEILLLSDQPPRP